MKELATKYWKQGLVLLVLLLVGGVYLKKKYAVKEINVAVETVERRTLIEKVAANGRIEPVRQVRISSEVSGEIIELHIKEGQQVEAGELLVLINPDILTATVERLEAALNTAHANEANAKARQIQTASRDKQSEADLKRAEQLYAVAAISLQELEQSKLAREVADAELRAAIENTRAAAYTIKSAEATLSEARRNLLRTAIYAPRSGTITKLSVEKGERVVGTAQMAGTEMLRIADLSAMMVEVEVNENDINRISVGDAAEITADAYPQRFFPGRVIEVSYTAIEKAQTAEQVTSFMVKVLIDSTSYQDIEKELNRSDTPFRPGMSAEVEIRTISRPDVVSVPIQSVTLRPDSGFTGTGLDRFDRDKLKECIFLVKDNKARKVAVQTGIQDDKYIEILNADSLITQEVIKGPYADLSGKIKDGDWVKKVEEKELFKIDKD